jgi:glucose/mannose-6-phosphate isomerase
VKLKLTSNQDRQRHNQLVADSIRFIPKQIAQVVEDWTTVQSPGKTFNQVIVCGMGGSALGADIVRYACGNSLTLPLRIVNDYRLPAFADKESLIVIASYSGNTEESLSCYTEARRKKLPLFVIAAGGKLGSWAARDGVARYIFNPKYNPSLQPRLGLGYGVAALLMLLHDIKASHLKPKSLLTIAKNSKQEATATEVALFKNRSVIIIASEHLIGVAHALSNQMNETAKTFAPYFTLPELNHHLLEGLGSLRNPKKEWVAIFLSSDSYYPRVQKRYDLTEAIFQRQKISFYEKTFKGDRLTQGLRCLYWSASLTYKVAVAQGLDTTSIPWVDYFKQQLR